MHIAENKMAAAELNGGGFLLLVAVLLVVEAAAAAEVVREGATVGPGYVRMGGELAAECPPGHPFPMEGYTSCCSQDSDFVSCPALPGRRCRINVEATHGGTVADMNRKGHECYLFEDSRTIFEGTYVNLVWNCPSLFDCLLECQGDPGCEFFVYRASDASCHLRRDHTHNLYFDGHYTGMSDFGCPCFETGVVYLPPGDPSSHHLARVSGLGSPVSCQAECAGNPDCLFWAYATPGHQVDPDACHLRGGPLGAKTQADRIISGPKICPLVQDNQP